MSKITEAMERVERAATTLIYAAERVGRANDDQKLWRRRELLTAGREYGAAIRALARLRP